MRTIIAGSRSLDSQWFVQQAMQDCGWKPSVVISGTARGIDLQGEAWAKVNRVEIERYPADWNKHGKSAGYIRNSEMAKVADALVAIWDGQSKGTEHMINLAKDAGLQIFIYCVKIQTKHIDGGRF